MRKLMFGSAAAIAFVAVGAVLAAPIHPCRADLDRLSAQVQAIGFQEVLKPGQAHVLGAGGHDHTGGTINYIQAQIRQAYVDCDAGRVQIVRERIAVVRAELARGHG
jgi:hypothetical protein